MKSTNEDNNHNRVKKNGSTMEIDTPTSIYLQ